MILKWNKPSVTKVCGHFVYPGANNLPDKDKEAILNDPWVKQKMEMSPPLIEIIEKTKEKIAQAPQASGTDVGQQNDEDEVTDDITEMSASDAISVVKETLAVPALEEMKAKEKRKSVLKAIEKQIDMIKSTPEEDIKEDDK